MSGRLISFPRPPVSATDAREATEAILRVPYEERAERGKQLQLEEPEVLLAVVGILRTRLESSPLLVKEETEFLYRFLDIPRRPIGLFDEREYFLGESALLAGTASRILGLRDFARWWFDRAEANFRLTVSGVSETARVSYQRLALRLEERQFDDVLELAPPLIECFMRLDMSEDALKCRFLEALTLVEMGRTEAALDSFQDIARKCELVGNDKLTGSAYVNLIQLYAELGRSEEAVGLSRATIPLLRRLENRVDEAKVHWGIGTLLRSEGKFGQAVEAYRSSQRGFEALEMRADVAAAQLVIADLLLELGQEVKATAEILLALPIIDELKMVPEGMAALSLLRESIRQQKVNRTALRDLHGYFEELQADS